MNIDELLIIKEVSRRGGAARLLGGRAIAHLCYERAPKCLQRVSQDIDIFVLWRDRKVLIEVLEGSGAKADREFNILNGRTRLLYHIGSTKIDVFIDQFQMCHLLSLADRIKDAPVTLPPADLLLTKLQIVEINEKDLIDSAALLLALPIGQSENENLGIDAEYIAMHLARDWGLWRTVTKNLELLGDAAKTLLQEGEWAERLATTLRKLGTSIDTAPKTFGWRLRSVIGDKMVWYETPEEP